MECRYAVFPTCIGSGSFGHLGFGGSCESPPCGGKDVLGFSAGEPDLAPPAAAVAAVRQAIEDGKHGYEPVPGTPEAREAIAAFHRKGGVDCTADDIVLTAGGKMAALLGAASASGTRSW